MGEQLTEDSTVPDNGGCAGVTLADNARGREEVNAMIEEARAARARSGREPAETFWGGLLRGARRSRRPPWEVAHNPRWAGGEYGPVTVGTDA